MRTAIAFLMVTALGFMGAGCGRMFSEGMGAATGASGKVVENGRTPSFMQYKGLQIEPVTVAAGTPAPADVPRMVQAGFEAGYRNRGLTPDGQPALRLTAEVIHYETSGTVDTAIGPLAELIVRAKLIDVQSGKVLAEANLVGRAKASSSSGAKNLSAGVGKALGKWLNAGGLKKEKKGGKDEEED